MSHIPTGTAARTWRPGRPVDVAGLLGRHRRGRGDPTLRGEGSRIWRACRTPHGPASLVVARQDAEGLVVAEAWGSGADWVLEQLPRLLGEVDDWTGFEPRHALLADARRRHPHLRIGRTDLVFECLVPTIIEQKVTGQEAFAGFRSLVRRYGAPAPGPGAERGLMVQPAPEELLAIPSWEWLEMHIDPARSGAVLRAARVARRLEAARTTAAGLDIALRSLPGIGVWTSAEVRQRALGDPDAVSFGDYHIAKDVGHVLAGHEFDDRELAEFLEPWRPQRGRVPLLLGAAGLRRPRHGARMAPRNHLPSQR